MIFCHAAKKLIDFLFQIAFSRSGIFKKKNTGELRVACRQFHAGINRFILHLSSITSHFLNVLLWMIFNLLTAQLQACAGLVLHVVFFFFFLVLSVS